MHVAYRFFCDLRRYQFPLISWQLLLVSWSHVILDRDQKSGLNLQWWRRPLMNLLRFLWIFTILCHLSKSRCYIVTPIFLAYFCSLKWCAFKLVTSYVEETCTCIRSHCFLLTPAPYTYKKRYFSVIFGVILNIDLISVRKFLGEPVAHEKSCNL